MTDITDYTGSSKTLTVTALTAAPAEAVTAVVVLKPAVEASEEDIIRHCKAHLGGFEVPKAVRFVEALPMTSTGKIQKQPLRQKYQALYGEP